MSEWQPKIEAEEWEIATHLVGENISGWGWGPLDEIDGLAEHDLAVKAAATALAYARTQSAKPSLPTKEPSQ